METLIAEAFRLHRAGQREESLALMNRALTQEPRNPHALNTRGMILDSLGRHEEALADVQAALGLQPDLADAIVNRGLHHARVGEFDQALVYYDRSLALDPTQSHARYNSATARIVTGDWLRGFRDFESRWAVFPFEAARRNRLKPVWLGERDIAGKTVLLHHEQGYGDTLQFCRYAILVMRLGARVLLAVPAALRTLLATLPGQPPVYAEGDEIPEHDYCCSLMSLPHVFSTTPTTVPVEVPYLRADPHATAQWRERLGPTKRLRIGLVWSGRRYPPINYPRDMTLASLQPLFTLDADFVCLQQQLWDSERLVLQAAANVLRYDDQFADFAETAALIENLDLVITVDTAIAHLAGALGKSVWLMNRYVTCWRWLRERTDSPWYPTLRLFRQPTLGDWANVVKNVLAAAQNLIEQHHSAQPVHCTPEQLAATLQTVLTQHHGGQLEAALAGYTQLLHSDPLQPQALHLKGIALAQLDRHAEALAPLSELLRLKPDHASAHTHYANALTGLERYESALESYDRAIALDPISPDAHYNRGCTLAALSRYEEAVRSYEAALALNPHYTQAHNNLGNALYELSRYEEALQHQRDATHIDPRFAEAWVNAAITLRRLGRYEEAITYTERALTCQPDHAEALNSRGAIYAALGRHEQALQDYQRALELKPGLAEATWNEALAYLSRGELREGWTRYEARWNVKSLNLTPHCRDQAPWLGHESIEGEVILLHAEQGYGDSIQFCRYAPLVAARGARVLLGVPRALQRLMTSLEGVEAVVAQAPVPPFDRHCPLLSLPLAFGTELTTIPAQAPYLKRDPADCSAWRSRLGPRWAPRVGFLWSGRPTHTNDANRSIPLREFFPLTRCELQVVSLQKEIRAGDLHTLAGMSNMHRLGEELTDFADTAALLSQLDLIITVDTAVAHLAGALGLSVWILLPYVADWRWLQGRQDSPWYPTARLFRQSTRGDWASVIERVRVELAGFLAPNSHHISQHRPDTPLANPLPRAALRSHAPVT
jgi:tetratricopeptide (TPR) repeat protein